MAAVAAALAASGILAWPFTVDDAFIIARYADNLSNGSGYRFNPDGPLSDGVTGPSWLLPHLLARAMGGDALVGVAVAKAVGLASAIASVLLWCRRLRGRAQGRAIWALSIPLWVCAPDLAVWSVAGLASGVALLLASAAALAATARPRPRGWAVGAAIGALAWLRPELAAFGAALVASLWLRRRSEGLVALALSLGCVCGLIVFRHTTFGRVLPLSYYAKPAELAHGLGYLARFALVGTSGIGLALALWGGLLGRRGDRVWLAALLAHLLAVVLAGGDWMPGFRLLVPVMPLYIVLAAVGAHRLLRRGRVVIAVLSLALACSIPAVDLASRIGDLRAAAHSRRTSGHQLARWLRQTSRRVALVDIGYLGLVSGVEIIDLAGITDPAVAHLPGGHLDKRIDEDWLRAEAPDTIVLHSTTAPTVRHDRLRFAGYPVERRVAAMPWVVREFALVRVVHYAPRYYYAVLRRGR